MGEEAVWDKQGIHKVEVNTVMIWYEMSKPQRKDEYVHMGESGSRGHTGVLFLCIYAHVP